MSKVKKRQKKAKKTSFSWKKCLYLLLAASRKYCNREYSQIAGYINSHAKTGELTKPATASIVMGKMNSLKASKRKSNSKPKKPIRSRELRHNLVGQRSKTPSQEKYRETLDEVEQSIFDGQNANQEHSQTTVKRKRKTKYPARKRRKLSADTEKNDEPNHEMEDENVETNEEEHEDLEDDEDFQPEEDDAEFVPKKDDEDKSFDEFMEDLDKEDHKKVQQEKEKKQTIHIDDFPFVMDSEKKEMKKMKLNKSLSLSSTDMEKELQKKADDRRSRGAMRTNAIKNNMNDTKEHRLAMRNTLCKMGDSDERALEHQKQSLEFQKEMVEIQRNKQKNDEQMVAAIKGIGEALRTPVQVVHQSRKEFEEQEAQKMTTSEIIAKNLLKIGKMDVETISTVTGLSKQQVEKLKE